MSCSRRALVRRLLQDLGAGVGLILHRSLPPALAAEEESARNQTGPLTVRVTRPFDAETPVREFTSFLTPNHRFFVRSHFGPPPAEAVAGATWTLHVTGLVERERTLTLEELQQFQPVTITSVLQCRGRRTGRLRIGAEAGHPCQHRFRPGADRISV